MKKKKNTQALIKNLAKNAIIQKIISDRNKDRQRIKIKLILHFGGQKKVFWQYIYTAKNLRSTHLTRVIYHKMRIFTAILLIILCIFLFDYTTQPHAPQQTAQNIDIKKYMGLWHEVARTKNPFESGVVNAQAKYSLNTDNTVSVLNTGIRQNGTTKSAKGKAYAPNPKDFSKLKVTFFWPFYGDYNILAVGKNYSWALVASDKYLWILSRTIPIPQGELAKILQKAASFGYATDNLIYNLNTVE